MPYNQFIPTYITKVTNFARHKVVSVINIPTNFLISLYGACGIGVSCLIVGAFKVFVFAVSLGNIQPQFSSGYSFFKPIFIRATTNLAKNLLDLGKDLKNLTYRFLTCFEKSYTDEPSLIIETPGFLKWIADPTQLLRNNINLDDSSSMLKHMTFSFINVPLNTLTAIAGIAYATILLIKFLAKSFFYALTSIHIAIPTGVTPVFGKVLGCMTNIVQDLTSCVAESFALIYNGIEATGLIRVAVRVRDIILYIPVACCDRQPILL